MSKDKQRKVRAGITVGDVNGIGLEVILKTFKDGRMFDICIPVIYGSAQVMSYHRKALGLQDMKFTEVSDAGDAGYKRINVVRCWDEEITLELGEATDSGGKYAFCSLENAVQDLASNKIDVLITAPINKKNIQSEEFRFPGHTEYLADYANEENPLMVMASGPLRVAMATGHIPLKEVSEALSRELILTKLETFQKTLIQDFGIRKPKIAVLGLNPHSGDNGLLGQEEQNVITPAIRQANDNGVLAFGPYGADGFFGSSAYQRFDGILAMYHDQGLAPFKALSFDEGVNYTAGLPIVRTAPDHGTAYELAGKNEASEQSFRNAVYLACDIWKQRKFHKQLLANQLKPKKAESRS